MSACERNESLTIQDYQGCDEGTIAYKCPCDPTVICCENEACRSCYNPEQKDELFTFSWPLVAGWYAMLVVLFCFGRRGRFVNRSCFSFGRRRQDEPARNMEDDDRRELEPPPVVKTRELVEADVGAEPPTCVICLDRLAIGDVIASLDCPHLYHGDCIAQWLRRKSTCPLCAQRIDLEGSLQSYANPDAAPPSRSTRLVTFLRRATPRHDRADEDDDIANNADNEGDSNNPRLEEPRDDQEAAEGT